MEENSRQKILDAGVNMKTAMERFMNNEDLLVRFLKKFSQDPNYGMFKEAMAEKRYEDAFKAAHTLKGLCGNLSLEGLFDIVSREVEFLRNKQYPEAEEALPEVVQEYEKITEILDSI